MITVFAYLIGFILTFILLKLWSGVNGKKKLSKVSIIGKIFLSIFWPITLIPIIMMFFIQGILSLGNSSAE